MRLLFPIGCLVLALIAGQPVQAGERVSFPGAKSKSYPYVDKVRATLQMPDDVSGRVPAVIILHGSGGIDGRGAFHARALNDAGIATLEVYMFDKGNRPKQGHTATLTHAVGALKYLAGRPDIDPNGIGVMGFSWGGNMSLRLTSKNVNDNFGLSPNGLHFAAHAPFYPVFWAHMRMITAPDSSAYGDYKEMTGAPIMIFAGALDDYGDPDASQQFVNLLTAEERKHIRLQVYSDATHGFDRLTSERRTIRDRYSHNGKGGSVRFYPNRSDANDARKRVVEFFSRTLRGNS